MGEKTELPAKRGPKRRQYAPRRRRSYARRIYGRFRRRVSSAKIPVEVAVAGISIPFTPAKSGYTPMYLAPNPENIMIQLKSGLMGMENDGTIDFGALLNPFNMESARYTKMLIYASLISKVRRRLVKLPMKKVPFLGRYIS